MAPQKEIAADEFLRTAYFGLLGREIDALGLETYRNAISCGTAYADILADIIHSDEFCRKESAKAEDIIRSAFRGLLGREPEPTALESYTKTLLETRDLPGILAEISASEEFKAKALICNPRPAGRGCNFTAQDLEEDKIVFLHHPKTGGTTLHEVLVRNFDKEYICPERFNGLAEYAAGQLGHYRLFSGHFDLPSVKLIPGRKKIITFLREPVARLISLYYFLRAHRMETCDSHGLDLGKMANELTMGEFFGSEIIKTHPWINNSMTRALTETICGYRWETKCIRVTTEAGTLLEKAKKELDSLTAVGILEQFDNSVKIISDCLGIQIPDQIQAHQVLEVIMDSNPGLRRITKEPVTEGNAEIIRELVKADIELYNHACEIFKARLEIFKAKHA